MIYRYCRPSSTLLLVLTCALAYGSPLFGQTSSMIGEASLKSKLEVSYIPPSAVGVMAIYPRSILLSKDMEFAPREIFSALGLQYAGIDPVDIDQMLVVVGPPTTDGSGTGLIVAHFAKPFDKDKIFPFIQSETVAAELDGKPYRKGKKPGKSSMFVPDDRTILLGYEDVLKKAVANHAAPQTGKVSTMLSHVGTPDMVAIVHIEQLRPAIATYGAKLPLPGPFASVLKVPDLVQYVAFKFNLTGDMNAALTIRANDETAAQQLEAIINGLVAVGRPMAIQQALSEQVGDDAELKKVQSRYMRRAIERMFEILKPQRKGSVISISGNLRDCAPILMASSLLGLGLPAVQSARGSARGAVSSNNLKQIMLAALNYESAKGTLPSRAIFSKEGKPLLSWRVMLLPYVEEGTLYKKFHLDEPWDSPNNRALIPYMPKTYTSPNAGGQSTKSPYLAVVGKGLMFDGDKGRKMAEVTDGVSNTIMFVEVKPEREVIWTKPDDWEFDDKHPLAGLGGQPDGFTAAFADGSVRKISFDIDPDMLKALFTIAGGEQANR